MAIRRHGTGASPQTRNTPPLRHWDVAAALREDIARGRYPVGERLPTEQQLVETFAVSRHTLREALRALTEDGLISRRPRTGSTVTSRHPRSAYAQTVHSIQQLLNYGTQTVRETILTEFVVADHQLAFALQCAPGASWFHIQALRHPVDDPLPLAQTDIYVLPAFAGVMRHPKHLLIPIADQIEELYGVSASSTQIDISASEIDEATAVRLNVPAHSPGLTVVRSYRDENDSVYEVAFGVHAARRYTYSFQLKRDRSGPSQGAKSKRNQAP
jgi:GntR family transcriptional regulator